MSKALKLAAVAPALVLAARLDAQAPARVSLETVERLRLHNVAATPVTMDGKAGLRVTASDAFRSRVRSMSAEERRQAARSSNAEEQLAFVEGIVFANGTIEAEIAGAPAKDAPEGARGFVGVAFRVQPDLRTYDAFYLRPTNGRADDQLRRNHATQYIAHPDWPWFRLREETPGKYESYVDLVTGAWTRIRIEVDGAKARLFVHGEPQPTLVVNDVKSGANGTGGVALWIDSGTEAHFRDLVVRPR